MHVYAYMCTFTFMHVYMYTLCVVGMHTWNSALVEVRAHYGRGSLFFPSITWIPGLNSGCHAWLSLYLRSHFLIPRN